MEKEVVKVVVEETSLSLKGFSPVNSTRIFWRSRKRSGAIGRNSNDIIIEEEASADKKTPTKAEAEAEAKDSPMEEKTTPPEAEDAIATPVVSCVLSEKRKALFEPLEPINGGRRGVAFSNESLIPPPDFDSTSYPKGWLVGKRRKLVNVDVVESMRRIAVQELNRKDREIDGLNEQLEEDARCLEHIQLQLLQEKSKRAEVERENNMLQDQISMLMNMLDDENNPDPAAASAGEEDDHEEP